MRIRYPGREKIRIRDGRIFGIRDGKNSDPGWKKLGSGMEKIRIRDPGWRKVGSGMENLGSGMEKRIRNGGRSVFLP
jgi:hypothetical protein